MNRKIKFRAFDKLNNAFAELYTNVDCMNNLDNDNVAIMQYTGLNDVNKKEIYEGDIVNIFGDICIIEYGKQDIGHDWQGIGFFTREKNGSQFNIFGGEGIEVVGNIHENSELLS